jgi:hypothetical protein
VGPGWESLAEAGDRQRRRGKHCPVSCELYLILKEPICPEQAPLLWDLGLAVQKVLVPKSEKVSQGELTLKSAFCQTERSTEKIGGNSSNVSTGFIWE